MGVSISLKQLFKRANGRCHYCNRKTSPKSGSKLKPTKDHVVPKSKGGLNKLRNVVLACHKCNQKKADESYDDFRGNVDNKEEGDA